MSITLDYENYAEQPYTLVAEENGKSIAACCGKYLDELQTKMDLLLLELGYNLYFTQVEEDGFIIY